MRVKDQGAQVLKTLEAATDQLCEEQYQANKDLALTNQKSTPAETSNLEKR